MRFEGQGLEPEGAWSAMMGGPQSTCRGGEKEGTARREPFLGKKGGAYGKWAGYR